ncbi:hypothetical protein PF003_g30020 [Phytophthora fragariae]|nr:hypothetical protein PF003_g30020 [Phytophthora fragariae]
MAVRVRRSSNVEARQRPRHRAAYSMRTAPQATRPRPPNLSLP